MAKLNDLGPHDPGELGEPGEPGERVTADGRSPFRMPAEWEPVAAVWIAWPHNLQTWPGRFAPVPARFAHWVAEIAPHTAVRVLAAGAAREAAQSHLAGIESVEIVETPTNDCWVRDYGPTFVIREDDGSVHGIDWRYNAWGGKYPPWDLDQAAAAAICRHAAIPRHRSSLCLEGGALETDGGGRLLTTRNCLLTPTRNPGWSSDQIARELHRRLGVTEIVWLEGEGLQGDDTDGHIDQLARFIDPQRLVVAVCDDPADPNHQRLEQIYRQLHLWADATHPRVEVHRLPIPPARSIEGHRVPESYCNFLRLGADRILVPTFSAASDEYAVDLLRRLSGAAVVAIDCRDLVWGLGALHCASREQPQSPAAAPLPQDN